MSFPVDADAGVYEVNCGGPVNLPKPHIIDAVWTDDYGREYHVVGRERLTAAEDEIARLTIDLAETERERQKAVEREAKTAEALRKSQTVVADVAAACGLNGSSLDRTVADAARRLIADTDALQRRVEWAEKGAEEAVKRAEQAESSAAKMAVPYEDAYRSGYDDAPLPTPDRDNPAHLRWFASFLDTFTTAISPEGRPWAEKVGGVYDEACQRADRLEAVQQQDEANDTLRAEVERVVIETTDVVLDKLAAAIAPAMDIEAAKASMRPAIRDAVDAVLADLRGGDDA